jgi:vitamin B12 transporter
MIQGGEVEGKTVPFFNTSLSAGYTFVEAKNRDTGEILPNIPRQILKLGLHYDDKRSFRASLLGRYVWFNASLGSDARDKAIIWDMSMAKKVFAVHDTAVELFFTGHNLFNGAQYSQFIAKNARRWLEGGIRFNF